MSKKKYAVWVAAGIAVLVGVIVFCVLAFSGNAKAKELEEQLSLANRYLQELDYENAVAAFQSALEIEPKSEEAYLGLADAYVGLGDYEAALQALTEGIEKTQSDALRAKLSEVEALAGVSGADGGASDGEAQAEGGRNAYGAVVFEEREGYREFSELTAQEQEFVETCVNVAVAHEGGLLDALAEFSDIPDEFFLKTKCGEYKVSLSMRLREPKTYGDDSLPDGIGDSVFITLRSENGMGYLYDEVITEGPVIFNASCYSDGVSKQIDWTECPCTDWQWNGSRSGERYHEIEGNTVYYAERTPDVMGDMTIKKRMTTVSGSIRMGLLQGDYVENIQTDSEYQYEDREEPRFSSSTDSRTEHYEDGWTQFDSGDWSIGSLNNSSVYTGERVENIADLPERALEDIFW